MAQYDGSIRIDTQINTQGASAQLMSLESRIIKAADKIASLRSKMDALKDAQIPTQEYQEIADQIAKAEAEFNKLLEKQEQMQREGKDSGAAWIRLNERMEELGGTIRYAQGELQHLVDTSEAFTLGQNSQEYANLSQQLQYAENDMATLNQRHAELEERQRQNAGGYEGLRKAAQKALSAIGSGLAFAGKTGKRVFDTIASAARKAFATITGGAKKGNVSITDGIKTMLKYGLGIRSLYVLFNRLRTAIKEGFANLAQVSEPVNASLSALQSSLTQMKNSLATAFAPILTAVAPMLQSLINMISQAATYVGMFIATLTGASSFTKAVAVQQDYAASLGDTADAAKKAAGALAAFDDINVLQKKEDGGAGKGAGALNPKDMFEEVPIDNKFKDMADNLKKMWEDSDFYDLGKGIGEWLKNALDNIPWDDIKERARKLGESLATLINGFVEVPGLGYSIGNALAQAINTGFEFLNAFVHELHWESIGKFIAESLNGLFENIDWKLIYDTFVTGAKGLGDAINSFVKNLNWEAISTSISNFINTFVDTLYTFITTINWAELGEKVGKTISDAWVGIDWAKIGETVGEAFIAFFDFIANAIENVDWQAVGETVKDFIVGIDWAGVANSFFEAVGAAFGGLTAVLTELIDAAWTAVVKWWYDVAFEDGKFTIEGLLKGIVEALANIGTWIVEHIFNPFIKGFKKAFGIASPSTVMAEIGGYLIEGLKNGIMSAWESMKEAVGNVASSVIDKFREVLGIHSPSKVMDENGAYLMEGLKNGIASNIDSVYDLLSGEKWYEIGTQMFAAFMRSVEEFRALWLEAFTFWQEENTELFFGYDLWYEMATLMFSAVLLAVEEFKALWLEAFTLWNEENILLFFGYDAWFEQWNNLILAYTDVNAQFMLLWQKNMKLWWETMVTPFFTVKQWTEFGTNMKNGIVTGFKAIVAQIGGIMNSLVDIFNAAINNITGAVNAMVDEINALSSAIGTPELPHISAHMVSRIKIPALASGAVIRGGNPFMAILGDQPRGQTNIEAPLDTIKQAVREELTGLNMGGGNVQLRATLNLNGGQVGELLIDDLFAAMKRQGYDVDVLGVT